MAVQNTTALAEAWTSPSPKTTRSAEPLTTPDGKGRLLLLAIHATCTLLPR